VPSSEAVATISRSPARLWQADETFFELSATAPAVNACWAEVAGKRSRTAISPTRPGQKAGHPGLSGR